MEVESARRERTLLGLKRVVGIVFGSKSRKGGSRKGEPRKGRSRKGGKAATKRPVNQPSVTSCRQPSDPSFGFSTVSDDACSLSGKKVIVIEQKQHSNVDVRSPTTSQQQHQSKEFDTATRQGQPPADLTVDGSNNRSITVPANNNVSGLKEEGTHKQQAKGSKRIAKRRPKTIRLGGYIPLQPYALEILQGLGPDEGTETFSCASSTAATATSATSNTTIATTPSPTRELDSGTTGIVAARQQPPPQTTAHQQSSTLMPTCQKHAVATVVSSTTPTARRRKTAPPTATITKEINANGDGDASLSDTDSTGSPLDEIDGWASLRLSLATARVVGKLRRRADTALLKQRLQEHRAEMKKRQEEEEEEEELEVEEEIIYKDTNYQLKENVKKMVKEQDEAERKRKEEALLKDNGAALRKKFKYRPGHLNPGQVKKSLLWELKMKLKDAGRMLKRVPKKLKTDSSNWVNEDHPFMRELQEIQAKVLPIWRKDTYDYWI